MTRPISGVRMLDGLFQRLPLDTTRKTSAVTAHLRGAAYPRQDETGLWFRLHIQPQHEDVLWPIGNCRVLLDSHPIDVNLANAANLTIGPVGPGQHQLRAVAATKVVDFSAYVAARRRDLDTLDVAASSMTPTALAASDGAGPPRVDFELDGLRCSSSIDADEMLLIDIESPDVALAGTTVRAVVGTGIVECELKRWDDVAFCRITVPQDQWRNAPPEKESAS